MALITQGGIDELTADQRRPFDEQEQAAQDEFDVRTAQARTQGANLTPARRAFNAGQLTRRAQFQNRRTNQEAGIRDRFGRLQSITPTFTENNLTNYPTSLLRLMGRGLNLGHGSAPRPDAGPDVEPRSLFSQAGTAANPSPQIPGATTGMRPWRPTTRGLRPLHPGVVPSPAVSAAIGVAGAGVVPGFPNSAQGAAFAPSPLALPPPQSRDTTGAPVMAPGRDTNRAWRGPVQPPADQTEAANPLTGAGEGEPVGPAATPAPAAPDVDAGRAMGYSMRGAQAPRGAPLGGNPSYTGGVGRYARSFSSPQSAGVYHDYVQRLFGGAGQSA